MKDLMQLVDEYAEVRMSLRPHADVQQARQRVADYIESIGAGGVSGALMGHKGVAGPCGQQCPWAADTARLQFMFDCVVAGRDPYGGDVAERVDKEYPSQSDVKTLDDFRRIIDICRGRA